MKKIIALSFVALLSLNATSVSAAGESKYPIPQEHWSFDGMLGTFDRGALQRGFQVYREVCAACHGLEYIAYRNLSEIGLNELQVKAVAAEYTVIDGPNDEGDMFERPGLPSDRYVGPYINEQQARATNNGAYPVDLSLITKARVDGSNYLHALLTGYETPPADFKLGPNMHYNKYYSGYQIAMPIPLVDGQVSYIDGTEATVDQMSRDVTQFLTWAAEPHMEARKRMGAKVLLFLIAFAYVMYLTKKKVWKDVE